MDTLLLHGEVFLMPNQDQAFNGDSFICEKFLKIKEHFGINKVLELGSAVGGTTKWLSESFDTVITTEINPSYRNVCLQRIKGANNVKSLLGDTLKLLPEILSTCDEKTLVFADDHWGIHCPLLDELRMIAEAGIKPVIAIHDFLVPDHPELGYDAYNGQKYEWDWIKEKVENIYGVDGYNVSYNSEATGAKRGIIYLQPK